MSLKPSKEFTMDTLISSILVTKRAHNSPGELNFVKWLHNHIESLGYKPVAMAEGAVTVKVGQGSKTLFSCHVDTVHSVAESDGSFQNIFFDEAFQHIFLGDPKASCLGADDGAGIYIMLKMMEAKVSGTYIFHRGEERGGISAHAMKKLHGDWLKQFHACIAFDRPNCDEVIITQGGTACASKAYGQALADALTTLGLKYQVSEKGVFTDSKVYNSIIPECINLGVGYNSQHSSEEYLNWNHLSLLTEACIQLNWSALKAVRVPTPEAIFKYKPEPMTTFDRMKTSPFGPWPERVAGKPSAKAAYNPYYAEDAKDDEPDLDTVDLEGMTRAELDELLGDEYVTNAVITLVCDLEAERAKNKHLLFLLGA